MRIGIDFTAAVEESAGIGRFTRELIRALLDTESDHSYVLVAPRGTSAPSWVARRPAARWVTLPASARIASILWHRLHAPIPVERFTGPLDLFHATNYLLPPLQHARGIVTVHDLSYKVHPEFAEPRLARYLAQRVPASLRRADLVLADSVHTKAELVQHYDMAPEQVSVVYGGVSKEFCPDIEEQELERVRHRYGLPPSYLLTVGRLEPRKNLLTLLKAYQLLVTQQTPSLPRLVIAGGTGWRYEPIFEAVSGLELTNLVDFLGYVPDEDLPALMAGAEAFLYPSYYEGFGLPPLEAMACGTPVVASNTSSLPEVVGDAGPLVSPHEPEALAQAVSLLLSNPQLRQDLRQKGLAQAARFTWEAAAQQLLEAYTVVGGSLTMNPARK